MFFGCHTTEITAAVRHILTLANLLLNFFGCMIVFFTTRHERDRDIATGV